MKRNYKEENKDDYAQLKSKMFFQLLGIATVAVIIVAGTYTLIWQGNGAEWIVSLFREIFKLDYSDALNLYQQIFRNNIYIIWLIAIIGVFFMLLLFFLNWFTRYFNMINRGIDALLNEDETEICLLPEMSVIERKLNTVKQTLKQHTLEIQLAEQRKNDLVMYLAHDIRTPLTSVIGYLSLLEEAPDMPAKQKEKYVHITLQKAYRLEKMINEFFEITRYNLQQINLSKETIDLYYMLVQLSDELSSILSINRNTTVLNVEENLRIQGDPDKLARVFNNVLKNAAAYSYPNTEITVSAKVRDQSIVILFQNKGKTIPKEKLATIFEKFYRLDDARISNTGGTGLGLAIAKEIVILHGGTIGVNSENDTITFVITLPIAA